MLGSQPSGQVFISVLLSIPIFHLLINNDNNNNICTYYYRPTFAQLVEYFNEMLIDTGINDKDGADMWKKNFIKRVITYIFFPIFRYFYL